MFAATLFRICCSCLLSKNIKIKIHKTVILRVVLYACAIKGEKHKLGFLNNKESGGENSGVKGKQTGGWSFMITRQILLGRSDYEG
jgi:hypothetical protein